MTEQLLLRHLGARVLALTGTIMYGAALVVAYTKLISPSFSYLGYTTKEASIISWVLLALIVGGLAMLLPIAIERPSQFSVWLLFLLVGVPSPVLANVMGRLPTVKILQFTLLLMASFVILNLAIRRRCYPNTPFLPPLTRSMMLTVLVAVWVAGFTYLGLDLGFRINMVSLADVYDVREDFGHRAGRIASYLVPWLGNAVNPAMALLGVWWRRWWVFAMAIFGQIALYGQTGLKTILFSIPAMAAVAVLLRWRRHASVLLIAVSLLVIVTSISDYLLGSVVTSSMFVRRFLVTPGLLTAIYYEFFSINSHTYLSQSILGPWIKYPYTLSVPLEVGTFWTRFAPSANANLFADGYANFGWIGMLVVSAMAGLLFRWYDRLSQGLPILVSCLLLVMPLVTLSNSALQTSLMTHGVGLVFVIVAVAPRLATHVSDSQKQEIRKT